MSDPKLDDLSPLSAEDVGLLARARGGLHATANDHARVRGKLAAQLGAAAGLGVSAAATKTAAAAGATSGTHLLAAKIVLATVLVTGVGATVALSRSPRAAVSASTTPAQPAASPREQTSRASATPTPMPSEEPMPPPEGQVDVPASPRVNSLDAPSASQRPRTDRVARPPSPLAMPGAACASATSDVSTPSTAAVAGVGASSRSTGGSPTANAPGAGAAIAPSTQVAVAPRGPSTVDAEADLLRRADAAVKAGEPSRALALVEEHAARFPNGVLVEEREAERIVVLCVLGRSEEARQRRAQFLRTRPRSPLVGRVRDACGGAD